MIHVNNAFAWSDVVKTKVSDDRGLVTAILIYPDNSIEYRILWADNAVRWHRASELVLFQAAEESEVQ